MPERAEVYTVWRRDDGYVAASAGKGLGTNHFPRNSPFLPFEELLTSGNWNACASRIRAERVAAVMNEDLWPNAETAQGNRVGATPWEHYSLN